MALGARQVGRCAAPYMCYRCVFYAGSLFQRCFAVALRERIAPRLAVYKAV